MRVTVYHNLSRDASFGLNTVFESDDSERGYMKRQGTGDKRHRLVKVFEYDENLPVSNSQILEGAFYRFNVGADEIAQAYRARRLRSLSVGDVIVLEDEGSYSVESTGFNLRRPDELRITSSLRAAEALIRSRYGFRPGEELSVTVPLS